MALKVLMLQKRLDAARAEAEQAEDALLQVRARERELEQAVDEADAGNAEEQRTVEEAVSQWETDLAAAEQAAQEKRAAVETLEAQIREAEARTENLPAPSADAPEVRRKGSGIRMAANEITSTAARRFFGDMPEQRRMEMFAREDVRAWLERTRACMRREPQERAIANVGLTIPDVMLGLLRAQLMGYSKLYRHVNVRRVQGDARQLISSIPAEAIWTDCCANLNEMTMTFYQEEFNCYRVGGYYTVCNANLEDSDLDLAAEILQALSEGIGMALDKAILFGRNASTTMKMPQGIVSRLVQTAAPSDYPVTARPWTDLHTSNVITIASSVTGADLFREIVRASGAAKSRYSAGQKTWAMNEATFTALQADALSVNAAGAVVSGMGGTMPVTGGGVELLEFLPDNILVGGYFDLYTLVERAGTRFASSEHVRFLQDETVFKGTARYDGGPSIAEGFVVIGLHGAAPSATMTFPPDTANASASSGGSSGSGGSDGGAG